MLGAQPRKQLQVADELQEVEAHMERDPWNSDEEAAAADTKRRGQEAA